MSAEKLFDIFYAVPNPQFNSYFGAGDVPTEQHPLADLIDAAQAPEPDRDSSESPGDEAEK